MSNDISTITTNMCKAARASGMSKSREHLLENNISKQLKSSGPLWVLSRLKSLQKYFERRVSGDDPSGTLPWISHKGSSYNTRLSGWMGVLNYKRPKTSLNIVGALIQAIEITDPTSSQYSDWKQNVVNSQKAEDPGHYDHISYYRKKVMIQDLAKQIAKQSVFGPEDITGSSVPLVNGQSINISKHNTSHGLFRDMKGILNAYLASINSAPPLAAKLEIDNINFVSQHFPDLVIKDKEARLQLAESILNNNQELAVYSSHQDPDLAPANQQRLDNGFRMGNIAFLEKPGGKLRTVANPNRYLQKVFRPLQHAYKNWYAHKPQVDVEDQQEAWYWMQRKLRSGIKLDSYDLHAATDCLDAESFMDYWFETRKPADSQELLDMNNTSFIIASQSRWFAPDLDSDVQWNVGQPLGLAPSFSYLTIMNTVAGETAVRLYNRDHPDDRLTPQDSFRVVGDDFVCDDRIGEYYNATITKNMGGITNHDKMMRSDKLAEFCSHYVTRNDIWAKKPRIHGIMDYYFVDLDKTGKAKLDNIYQGKTRHGFDTMYDVLAKWSAPESYVLPHTKSSMRMPLDARMEISAYMRLTDALYNREPEKREISLGTPTILAAESLISRKPLDPVSNLLDYTEFNKLDQLRDVRQGISENVSVYNWRSDRRERKVSPVTHAKHLVKRLQQIASDSTAADQLTHLHGYVDPYDKCELHLLVDKTTGESMAYCTHANREIDLGYGVKLLTSDRTQVLRAHLAAISAVKGRRIDQKSTSVKSDELMGNNLKMKPDNFQENVGSSERADAYLNHMKVYEIKPIDIQSVDPGLAEANRKKELVDSDEHNSRGPSAHC